MSAVIANWELRIRLAAMNRRAILKCALVCGFSSRLAGQTTQPGDAAAARPQEGDLLVKTDDPAHTPLKPGDIRVGVSQILAWPMDPTSRIVRAGSRFNQILVVRLDQAKLRDATKPNAAEGIVAFSAICTHSGCEVEDWLPDEQLLSCACHESVFDPANAALVVGGPAPRALPGLPLKIVDGTLVVAKPFTAPVGYEG